MCTKLDAPADLMRWWTVCIQSTILAPYHLPHTHRCNACTLYSVQCTPNVKTITTATKNDCMYLRCIHQRWNIEQNWTLLMHCREWEKLKNSKNRPINSFTLYECSNVRVWQRNNDTMDAFFVCLKYRIFNKLNLIYKTDGNFFSCKCIKLFCWQCKCIDRQRCCVLSFECNDENVRNFSHHPTEMQTWCDHRHLDWISV